MPETRKTFGDVGVSPTATSWPRWRSTARPRTTSMPTSSARWPRPTSGWTSSRSSARRAVLRRQALLRGRGLHAAVGAARDGRCGGALRRGGPAVRGADAGGRRRAGRGHRRRPGPGLLGRLPGGRPAGPLLAPTSPGSACIMASRCRSRCPPSSASSARSTCCAPARRVGGEEAAGIGLATGWWSRRPAGGRARAGRGDRRRRRSPSARSGRRCAGRWRTGCGRRPTGNWRSRTGCGRRRTSPRASARPRSDGLPDSRAGDHGPFRMRSACSPSCGSGSSASWDPELSLVRWRELLADAGWACPTWPRGWCGRSLSAAWPRS